MNNTTQDAVSLLQNNALDFAVNNSFTLFVALMGGLILGGYKLLGHYHLAQNDKFSNGFYCFYLLFCIIALPLLGSFVTSLYLANGDKIQPFLAFQIGLTSPAIVSSLLSSAANALQVKPIKLPAGA